MPLTETNENELCIKQTQPLFKTKQTPETMANTNTNTITKKWYKEQKQALDADPHGLLYKFGNFSFTTFASQNEFIEHLEVSTDRQYYEVLMTGKPQRMVADIDGDNLKMNDVEVITLFHELMDKCFTACGLKFKKNKVKMLGSSKANKLSIHWSYDDGLVFANHEAQKQFWQYVSYLIETDEQFAKFRYTYTQKANPTADEQPKPARMELRNIVDLAIYTANRAFRTIYSYKEGQADRAFIPYRLHGNPATMVKCQDVDIDEYLIMRPDETAFYDIKIPAHEPLPAKKLMTFEDIKQIILERIPNVEVVGMRDQRFIQLKTVGARVCLIGGEENQTDNCFAVWRRDGLYFGCHDADCVGKLKNVFKIDKYEEIHNQQVLSYTQLYEMGQKAQTTADYSMLTALAVKWVNEGENCTNWYVKLSKPTVLHTYYDTIEKEMRMRLKSIEALKHEYMNRIIPVPNCEFKDKPAKPIKPFIEWMNSPMRNEVNDINFSPAHYFKAVREGKSPHSYGFYNIFNGFQIPYEEAKTAKPFTEEEMMHEPFFYHIRARWCKYNPALFKKVLDIFASIYQQPQKKLNISLVLQSPPRCGKGIIMEVIKDIIGSKYYFQPLDQDKVLGSFNGQLVGKLITFIDELGWGGDKLGGGILKKLITEKTITINEKFVPTYTVNNTNNIFIASNEDWVVPAGCTEQRFLVLELDPELAHMDEKTRIETSKAIAGVDRKRLAHTLLMRDLSQFNDRKTINTEGLRHQKLQSATKLQKWWCNCLNAGYIAIEGQMPIQFNEEVQKDRLYDIYTKVVKNHYSTTASFWKQLGDLIGEIESKRRVCADGIRRRTVKLPTLEACRDLWCKYFDDEDWEFEGEFDETDNEYDEEADE